MRFLVLGLLFLPAWAEAASLLISPSLQSVSVGEQVTIEVVADTEGQAVTAAEGELTYDPALLEPVLVSTAGSAFSMWATAPDTEVAGTVRFSGWAGTPQSGGNLRVLTATFRAVASGEPELSLASGALLANDGKGSNIITTLGRARVSATLATAGQVLGVSNTEAPPSPPVFTVFAERAGDPLVISGESEPGSRVVFTLSGPSGERTLTADAPQGTFVLVDDRLDVGTYTITGETYTAAGVLGGAGASKEFSVAPSNETLPLAAAFVAAPSYLTLLVGFLSFLLGFGIYRMLAKSGYLP